MYTFICEFVDVYECRPQLFNCTRAHKTRSVLSSFLVGGLFWKRTIKKSSCSHLWPPHVTLKFQHCSVLDLQQSPSIKWCFLMGPCAHLWPPLGTFSSLKFSIVLLQQSQKSPEKRGSFPWARVHIFGLHFALSIICTFLNSFATEPKDPCKKRALFDRLVWTLLAFTWHLQLYV